MVKSSDSIGISPVGRVSSVLSTAAVGDLFQEIESRTAQFAKGQQAHIPIGSGKEDTSLLLKNNVSTASFSAAAHLIDQLLKQAETAGVTTKYIAKEVVTNSPKIPEAIAKDLKAALSNSGLFYESHLEDYVEGYRSLAEIKQQPQNQPNPAIHTLLSQQLGIFENQRLSWHGEVWEDQKMDWDIYVENEHESAQGRDQQSMQEALSIASDVTLHLPHLGKVTARLRLVDGRMRISMFAEELQTIATLKAESASLIRSIEKHGQMLEGLTVTAHD